MLARIVDLVHAEGPELRREAGAIAAERAAAGPMSQVVVVGGGITGLAAARRLALAGLEVTVLEAGSRWGGKVAPVVGWTGSGWTAARSRCWPGGREAVALVASLGSGRATWCTRPAPSPGVLVGGRLHRLPPSVQGVPTDLDALRELLTGRPGTRGRRASATRPAGRSIDDVSIGGYVDERFGPEVTDRLLEPLLGGVYAGRSRELSFAAVAPELFARAPAGGSLAAARPGGRGYRGQRAGVRRPARRRVDVGRRPGR